MARDSFERELWDSFRGLQRSYMAEYYEKGGDEGALAVEYANKKINELSNVDLIDRLTR